jgi:hypothetical protein
MATIERLILDVKSKGRKLSEIKVQAPTEKSQTITEVDDLLKACDSLTTSPDPQMYLADIDPAVLNLRQATAAVNKCFSDRNKPYDQTSKTALKNALNQFDERSIEFLKAAGLVAVSERLLGKNVRASIPFVAFGTFIGAAVFATIGAGLGDNGLACVTMSYWLGAASILMGAVWFGDYLIVQKPIVAFSGTTGSGSPLQYIVFGTMAFLVLGFLITGLRSNNLLEDLSSIPRARGLITFLIAIGTISIALILAVASVIMDGENEEALKERLSKGKEILTVLVGVLGTIVGFYFANNSDSSAARMKLEILKSPGKVQEGMEFEVLAKATGGELPYEANVNIVGAEGLSASGVVDNKSGLITIRSKIVAAAPIKDFPVTIGLKDKSGRLEATTFHVEVEKKQ